MRKFGISVAAALAAVMAVTSYGFDSAQAAGRQQAAKPGITTDASTTFDLSAAAKKKKRRVYRERRGNPAAAAAAVGIFGAIAGAAIQNSYRDDYYYGGPGYRGYYNQGYAPRYRGNYYRGGYQGTYRGGNRSGFGYPGSVNPNAVGGGPYDR